ncbi:MAG: FecR domain-containing protein [Planctomycetota bacterium]|jgi:hypothetical protein
MKTLQTWLIALALGLMLSAAGVASQDPAPKEKKQDEKAEKKEPEKKQEKKEEPKKEEPAAPKEEKEAVLVEFKGVVDVKRPADKDWVAAERNMKLPAGSEICTSYGASAKLLFPGEITVDVQPLTQATIDTLFQQKDKVSTGVRLKFGAAEVDIKKSDIKTDMKVATPNSTTSVSGSSATVWAWARREHNFMMIQVQRGRWRTELEGGVVATVEDGGGLAPDGRTELDFFAQRLYEEAINFGLPEHEFYDPESGMPPPDPAFPDKPPYEENSSEFSPDADRQDAEGHLLPFPPGPP